jgi:Leucine-rich repeat (LRR) protein
MLAGRLPRELGKLAKLTWLFADNNRITGPLPREIGDLPNLFFIEIQNNKITGPIPSNYGPSDPIAIDPINLTNNMLSGMQRNLIHCRVFSVSLMWISALVCQPAWVACAYLYAHCIVFAGPIPPGYQNLDESAFQPGNPGLCGPPLSNPCN